MFALAGAAIGLGVGIAAEHSLLNRRRRNDPEAGEKFGTRRGTRTRRIALDDGAELFAEEAGPNRSSGAVFVHGSGLRTDAWHYQMPGLDDHRLVFYDLRGHGLSQPKGDSDYTIKTLASDLMAVVEDAGLEQVVIVGHSVGGMAALQLCSERPDLLSSKIKGLVLCNSTYRPAVETLAGGAAVARFERVSRRPLDFIGNRPNYVEYVRKVLRPSDAVFWSVAFAAFGPHASAKQIDFTYDMLADTKADVIFDLIKSYRDFDATDSLGDINVPTLVIGGTHDRLTVAHASEHLAETLPKAQLHLLDGCGHMTMLERHRDFNRLVAGFLDDTLGKRRSADRRRRAT